MAGNPGVLVKRMVYWCRDVSLGYSQSDRWDIRPGGNADCSSLVIHCLREAGFDTGSASYTGNMSAQLTARGWRRIPADGKPRAGDILLNDVHHVAIYIGNGQLAQASISEHGTAYGSGGDQTGQETNIRNYYNYPWNCYLRYTGIPNTAPADNRAVSSQSLNNDVESVISAMNATHVIFEYQGGLYIANMLAGTYTHIPNPQAFTDRVQALKRVGAKVAEWKHYTVTGSNRIGDIHAFGVPA
ncbi:hypothetical protein BPY_19180 [Bifidobacterium psychraerophilum]|uniref:Bacteriophage peptidoglycan hydrolase n=1 Tax=Bifidobacterium psychraerophilum TaxID=218140 RepID=A0A087CFQ2_9BIFI|nr:NlpC/P60 family protein [Bifidobacterium psychraerophilum]KFI82102.1 bacteriophage peptidoglycan hydrolase [Bifidobacterium psychraerophilum]PKA94905.1 NlpC/P60 family protein [Bifidobacterium psychraerophilum DSM 22366]